jgi:hypothetical protein
VTECTSSAPSARSRADDVNGYPLIHVTTEARRRFNSSFAIWTAGSFTQSGPRIRSRSRSSLARCALVGGFPIFSIRTLITHLAFYSGWANAMAVVVVTKDVFAERKIGPDRLPAASPALLPLNEAAEADRAKRVGDQFGAMFPASCNHDRRPVPRPVAASPSRAARPQPGHDQSSGRWRSTGTTRSRRTLSADALDALVGRSIADVTCNAPFLLAMHSADKAGRS